jgi:hypothetical protein
MSALASAVIEGPWRERAESRRKSLVAGRAYEAGEPGLTLDAITWCPQAEGTVAHPNGRHFRDPLLDGVAQSADPNCRLSFELMVLIARRDIRPGEVVSADFGSAR